jgi:hypothetical protein
MKRFFLTLLFAALCATGYGQTLKSLMYNTTNGRVMYSGTNVLTFTNTIRTDRIESATVGSDAFIYFDSDVIRMEATAVAFEGPMEFYFPIVFQGTNSASVAATTRTNLGLGATWLTNANVTNFRTAIGLGETNTATFDGVFAMSYFEVGSSSNTVNIDQDNGIQFGTPNLAAATRTNLALGATNNVAFRGITSDGNIVITNQTATNNGLLFVYRTNNEPFLGLANLIASNNTTISNETLFRVGTAEATNRSAQFGFRSTNTNGSGVAVFSVFGYNALMMVGADASTNAVIYSGGGTNNEVMTLIKSGATEFARPISFSTTAHAAATRTNLALGATSDPTFRDVSVRDLSIVGGSGGKIVYPATNTAPANTTNVVTWIQVNVGTNSYRVPLYQ